jgi:HNH endonuclease
MRVAPFWYCLCMGPKPDNCPSCRVPMPSNTIPRHLPVCLGPDPVAVADLLRIGRVTVDGDGCWEWTAKTNGFGYGLLPDLARERLGESRAHRAMHLIAHGPIPDGLRVCHHCDNPPCVNPAHLYAGTAKDNHQDSVERGRSVPPPPSKPRGPKLPRVTVKCPFCENRFDAVVGGHDSKRHRTCGSPECVAESRAMKRRTRITRACLTCRKEWETIPSDPHKYCSLECYHADRKNHVRADKGRWQVAREERACVECGEMFVAVATSKQERCSKTACRVAPAHRATRVRRSE